MRKGPGFLLGTHMAVWLYFHWSPQLNAALQSSLSGRYKSRFETFKLYL